MPRRTITFSDELFEEIEKYRKTKTPIPPFSYVVVELAAAGLKAWKDEQKRIAQLVEAMGRPMKKTRGRQA